MLLTAMLTRRMWAWPYQEWVTTSQRFHEQLVLVIPIAAAAAAYYSGRLVSPGRIYAQPWSVRSGSAVALRHLFVLSGSFVVSYLLGLVPLVVITVARAQAEGPYLLVMLTGLLGLVATTCIGYMLGVLFGTAWVSPFVMVLGFLCVQLSSYGQKFAATDPVTHVNSSLGRVEAFPITMYRIAFFVLLTVAATVVAMRALARNRRWKVPSPITACLLVAVAAGIVLPAVRVPAPLAEEENPPAVCLTDGGSRYCVHAGHRSELTAMREAGAAVLAAYGQHPPRPLRIRDAALASSGDDSLSADTSWVRLSPATSTREATAEALAVTLSGEAACAERFGPLDTTSESGSIARQLYTALLAAAGFPEHGASSTLGALDGDRLRSWISAHETAVVGCGLTGRDLP
jgi:hypothetical protein